MRKAPPRLIARTLAVTFSMVAVILLVVFVVLTVDVRQRVRAAEADKLQAGERLFTILEERRQRDQAAAVSTLGENPTLKAALETYFAERGFSGLTQAQETALRSTVTREADKLASLTSANVIVIVDTDERVFTAAGPGRQAWPDGLRVNFAPTPGAPGAGVQGVATVPDGAFRVTGAPLRLGQTDIGTLLVGTRLDAAYARELAGLAGASIVITVEGKPVASTLSPVLLAAFANSAGGDTRMLEGDEHAVRTLFDAGAARIYALNSIDSATRQATRSALLTLATIALGSMALAAFGSLWLARTLTGPIDRTSRTIATMTAARDFARPLLPTGSSREMDALTDAFNHLVEGLLAAEADTRAASVGAIRALAAALDARDWYTAGHSERVSTLSVAIGRQMQLGEPEIDILRLGALLHDIGKIGVPDGVLLKAAKLTNEEFEQIKRHPALGARILRLVPFLTPHLPIVELHHERPDGRGYPFGLRAEQIPQAAAIVHVADAFDAMTSARAYRPGRPAADAMIELHKCKGTDFDPGIVDAFALVLPGLAADLHREPALEQLLGKAPGMIRIVGTLALTMLVCVESAWGQTARPSSVAIDSVAAVEEHLDENGDGIWGLTLDTVLSVALSSRVQVIARPVVVRTTSGEWNNQIQPITLRYERRGPVALRVDGGFIPAPIGTGMLTVRPHLNPTIAQPSYYALTLPNFEPDGTRAQLASASYELGVLATLSGSRWDARVGITDSSPVRPRRVFGDTNPPRFAQVVAGGGVSPVFGMRIGVTVAHGGWAEAPDRSATLVSVEGEYGFRYTKVTAEWLRDRFERKVSGRAATASGWYAQAVQTLAPRWFVAGRIERVAIDPGLAFGPFAIGDPQHFAGIEETLGYRVTPEVTIRAGHRAREHFDRSTWDHQVSVSLVWARRWM